MDFNEMDQATENKKRKPEPSLDEPLVKMTVSALVDGDQQDEVQSADLDEIDFDAIDAAIGEEDAM